MLKFSSLHYEKNWFSALFDIMSKVINDKKSGQPVLSLKQTWGYGVKIFSDPHFGELAMEAKYVKRTLFEWDVFEAGKAEPFAHIKSHVFKTALMMGGEVMTVAKMDGKELIVVERESNSAMKHFVDNLSGLYNPTHVYALKSPSGAPIGVISAKQGLFKSFYDLELTGGTDKEKTAALVAFSFIVLMLKK